MQPAIAGIENLIERILGMPCGLGALLTGFRPTTQPANPLDLHLVLTVFVPVDMFAKLSFEAAPAVGVRILEIISSTSGNDSFIRGLLMETAPVV